MYAEHRSRIERVMEENQPTTKQIILFTVVLSFIVSVIGTVLSLGVLGPLLGVGESSGGPLTFNKPLEKIREIITQKETQERIIKQDELIVTVVEAASRAVVSIVATKDVPVVERYYVDPFGDDPFFRQFFGNGGGVQIPQYRQKGTEKQEVSAGSGFIVSPDGMIVTNKHVVADTGAEYTVFLNDGKKKTAKVLARDPLQDLAIIKIDGTEYPFLTLGDSSQVKIGQTVIAIGNALGEFRNTVSVGVVSGLQRSIMAQGGGGGPESLKELIQTDAAINPGNSGGPLLNIYGEVIGIDTAIAQGAENIGFAIPANKVKADLENVKKYGRIIYPFIGVRYAVITKEIADENKLGKDYGAWVVKSQDGVAVVAGSPAEKAGLRDGDIIFEMNGVKLDLDHTLALEIQKHQVGDEVALKIFREGREQEVKLKLEERK